MTEFARFPLPRSGGGDAKFATFSTACWFTLNSPQSRLPPGRIICLGYVAHIALNQINRMTGTFGLGQIVGAAFAAVVSHRLGSFTVPSITAVIALLVAAILTCKRGRRCRGVLPQWLSYRINTLDA